MRFFFAEVAGDRHRFDQIEGLLGRYYKSRPDAELRLLFAPGITLPRTIAGPRPIRLRLAADAPIAGLPPTL